MKTIRFMLLFMAALLFATASEARKKDDPKMRLVRLTMTDGRLVEGYIPAKYLMYTLQYQVKVADNPDGKKSKKYKAEDIEKMEWLTPTEEHPEGEVWEHCQTVYKHIISPSKDDCLLELLYRGKNASVYMARIYIGGLAVNENAWATWYALKPHGQEQAFLVYNASLGNFACMDYQFKDNAEFAGLKDFLQAWWDKDKSLAEKQLLDSPSIFSRLYDEWRAASGK